MTASTALPLTEARQLDLLMPLAFFYARAGLRLPRIDFLEGSSLPDPQRHLLVHASDMTPRLREFHEDPPSLSVISLEKTPEYIMREVLLRCSGDPVEYGAIGIHLDGFPAHVQQLIQEGGAPLGAILEAEGMPHTSAPTGYFRLEADSHMARLLGATPGTALYGRCNVLSHPDGTAFADIVEVLPPS